MVCDLGMPSPPPRHIWYSENGFWLSNDHEAIPDLGGRSCRLLCQCAQTPTCLSFRRLIIHEARPTWSSLLNSRDHSFGGLFLTSRHSKEGGYHCSRCFPGYSWCKEISNISGEMFTFCGKHPPPPLSIRFFFLDASLSITVFMCACSYMHLCVLLCMLC